MRGLVRLADRALLRVAGEGSSKFLQGLCTQDMGVLARQSAAPAAFLSPKGRVLCDSILVARDKDEVLIDCHSGVSKSLLRLLLRHRLREPLAIEDVSGRLASVALLPGEAAASEPPAADFFADPRFAGLGHRAVLEEPAAAAALGEAALDLDAYHHWRVCCAVPEGPTDLPVDSVLPLHANLDLLNFISFNKGCYVGQELTARTKHRGAVRRRFFSAVAAEGGAEEFLAGLQLPPHLPLPLAPLRAAATDAALPGPEAEEAARAVSARRPEAETEDRVGMLHSTAGNVGLCLLKCGGAFNDAESFQQAPLPPGTQLTTAEGSLQIAIRPPPYAFAA